MSREDGIKAVSTIRKEMNRLYALSRNEVCTEEEQNQFYCMASTLRWTIEKRDVPPSRNIHVEYRMAMQSPLARGEKNG